MPSPQHSGPPAGRDQPKRDPTGSGNSGNIARQGLVYANVLLESNPRPYEGDSGAIRARINVNRP